MILYLICDLGDNFQFLNFQRYYFNKHKIPLCPFYISNIIQSQLGLFYPIRAYIVYLINNPGYQYRNRLRFVAGFGLKMKNFY